MAAGGGQHVYLQVIFAIRPQIRMALENTDNEALVFSKATFSAAGYAAARPTYPPSLFRTILAYGNQNNRQGHRGTVLDLGCGHGLISREMSPHFNRVLGLDPSKVMTEQASAMTREPNIIFRQGRAEDLSFLQEASIEMAVAGQAAHWFEFPPAWRELARVIKPGGSLAFWGYKDSVLVGFPAASRILDHFSYAEGPVAPGMLGLGRYWEQPGRSRLRRLLRDFEPPASDWEDVRRIEWEPQPDLLELPDLSKAWMRKRIKLGELEAYVRTFSAFHNWRDAHTHQSGGMSRAEGGEGDVVDLMMDRIIESEPQWQALGAGWRDIEVEAAWGTYILLARRRGGQNGEE